MALRLVFNNAAAAAAGNCGRSFLAGPFRLVSVPAVEELFSRGSVDAASSSGHRNLDQHPSFFSDGFDFFHPTSATAQFTPRSFSGSQGFEAPAPVSSDKGYKVIKEDEKLTCLKMDMPGLDKDDVKITLEENKLVIKGGAAVEKETEAAAPAAAPVEEEESDRKYALDLILTPNVYDVDGIKAEMKNGVLKVTLPKVQEKEKKNVSINVE